MDILYYLWLESIKGCGSAVTTRLVDYFGSARSVYENEDADKLASIDGIRRETVERLIRDKDLSAVEEESVYIAQKGIKYVTYEEKHYPEMLREIYCPPPVLFYKGKNLFSDSAPCIAVVGSRNQTAYGKWAAETIARELAGCGVTVVSGLAAGIDSSAQQAAVKAGGRTIGVLGCGIETVYPASNKGLYEEVISSDGMIVTEFSPSQIAYPSNFPQRNRIISGLSYGTIVIEAAKNSGSLITAKYAAEQGREVYAVPGNINSPMSEGCNALIRDGAKAVTQAKDILEDLFHVLRPMVKDFNPAPKIELSPDEEALVNAVFSGKQTPDALASYLNKNISEINFLLTTLELKGAVSVRTGSVYVTYRRT